MSEKLNNGELSDIAGGAGESQGYYYEIGCGNFVCKFCHCMNENQHEPDCHFHNKANLPHPDQRCTMCMWYYPLHRGDPADCHRFGS